MSGHECIIGLLHDDHYDELVTIKDLFEEIKIQSTVYNDLCDMYKKYFNKKPKAPYTLKDYCDRRKSTNLTRFEYCPYCGKKIDWKKIKNEEMGV